MDLSLPTFEINMLRITGSLFVTYARLASMVKDLKVCSYSAKYRKGGNRRVLAGILT